MALHLDRLVVPVCRSLRPARVDADGGLLSLCELHPRVAHYRPTDARTRPSQNTSRNVRAQAVGGVVLVLF